MEVVVGFSLEVWNVEARRGLTPSEGEETVTLPSTLKLGQSQEVWEARKRHSQVRDRQVAHFGLEGNERVNGALKRSPRVIGGEQCILSRLA